jgi:hypothetical protein
MPWPIGPLVALLAMELRQKTRRAVGKLWRELSSRPMGMPDRRRS